MQPLGYLYYMGTTVKLSDELVSSAKRSGSVAKRSVPAQIEYWAKLGRIAEPDLFQKTRERAFKTGQLKFEDLSETEQEELSLKTIMTPTKTTFDPKATGEAVCEWDENLNSLVEYRPDGTAWTGKLKNRKFVPEKQIS
ncbi:MAG: hypothetical protein V4507_02450 [Verrucomicrobiota bacterium]